MNSRPDNALDVAGRIAVGLGIAVAVASAVAISYDAPDPIGAHGKARPDVIRLDPVVVTMSRARFEAMHAEMKNDSMLAQRAARLLRNG